MKNVIKRSLCLFHWKRSVSLFFPTIALPCVLCLVFFFYGLGIFSVQDQGWVDWGLRCLHNFSHFSSLRHFFAFAFPLCSICASFFLPGTSLKRVIGHKMMEYKCCTIRKQKWRNGTDKESMRSYADMFVFLGHQCCVLRVTKAKLGHEVGLSRKQRKRKIKQKKQCKPKILRGCLSIILC